MYKKNVLESVPTLDILKHLQSKGVLQLVDDDLTVSDHNKEMIKISKCLKPKDVVEIEGIPYGVGEVEISQKKYIAQHPFTVAILRLEDSTD